MPSVHSNNAPQVQEAILPNTSIPAKRNLALFETTKRLLAQIANEGLVTPFLEVSRATDEQYICLQNPHFTAEIGETICVKARIKGEAHIQVAQGKIITIIRPDDLEPPIIVQKSATETAEEWDPGTIFCIIGDWLPHEIRKEAKEVLVKELQNSAANQEKWLEIGGKLPKLQLKSPLIAWERSIIFGHPTHPLHRTCLSQPPLKPITPDDLPEMMTPILAFVSVPRSKLRISGHFDRTVQPLLDKLGVPRSSAERCTIPCFARQLPFILLHFPDAIHMKSIPNCAHAQASMRTVTLQPELEFPYHLKLSLACQITSSLRTITPWTTALGPLLTGILKKCLPPNLWIFEEVAAVTGSQGNFDEARHLSCILRRDLEDRARENRETLIVAAGLFQRPLNDHRTHAEILFDLSSLERTLSWFRRYISNLFGLVLFPLIHYGIGLEAHAQNMVVRVCTETKEIRGFAVRDFGGARLHRPTLQSVGCDLSSVPPESATITNELHVVWNKVHHSLLQSHVGNSLHILGLENKGGWEIVREELSKALGASHIVQGRLIYDYFLRETMAFKCFLRMRLASKYRDYVEKDVPNVVRRP